MTFFVYKRLIRNPEIANTSVWVLSNIWRLGQVRDTKLRRNISNEKLLNGAKLQVYSSYVSELLRDGLKSTHPSPRLDLSSLKILLVKSLAFASAGFWSVFGNHFYTLARVIDCSEAYLELCRISIMDQFAKKLSSF